MKKTPFTDFHIALGAKMHEFAGYNMPIEYSGIIDEHLTVVNSVGVFDVSHMGEFWVKGTKSFDFVQKVSSNDVASLSVGKAQYTCFVNENGGIIDDFLLYHYEPEKYMLVVNAANIEKDWAWCQKQNTMGAEIENASDHTAQLAVQGPKAKDTLQKLTECRSFFHSVLFFCYRGNSRSGQCHYFQHGIHGAGGFELYFIPSSGNRYGMLFSMRGKNSE